MGEPAPSQVVYFCSHDRMASNSIQFYSGHEAECRSSPVTSPRWPLSDRNSTLADKREKAERWRKSSSKTPKRTRKISLFSQFHFNSRHDDRHGKSRKISAPTISSLIPCAALPIAGYPEDIITPDLSSDSSTSSVQSQQSLPSLPLRLSVDGSPYLPRKASSNTYNSAIEKENTTVRDIILETLALQFEHVTQYKREVCDKLGKNVSELVRRRVEIMKEGAENNCKVVSLVYVGAVRENGIEMATQAILDSEKDVFTAASYRNGCVFAMAAIMVVALD